MEQTYPRCTVTVYLSDQATLATIYSNNNPIPTPKTNPFQADADGTWRFYSAAAPSFYISLSGGGLASPYLIGPIQGSNSLSVPYAPTGGIIRSVNDELQDRPLNVLGYGLKNDGVSDNCAAFADMQAVLTSPFSLYFPSGSYAVDQGNCPYGFVLSKDDTSLFFEPGAVFLAPLVSAPVARVKVSGLKTDCTTWTGACDGISSGAADVSYGEWTVEDYTYVGPVNYTANPSHAVLLQSGPNNTIENIRVTNAFHGVAVRSSNTSVHNVSCVDCTDVIVKSGPGSGSVENVSVSDVRCVGTAPGLGCMVIVTAQAAGLETANVTISDVTCLYSPYCGVQTVDSGGALYHVAWSNILGSNGSNGWYAYLGDANPANAMADTVVSSAHFWVMSGNGFQNSVAGAPISLNEFGCTATTNCVVGNFTKQNQMSGFNIWTGNTNDAALYSDSAAQGASTTGYTAEVPDGSGTFRSNRYQAGFSICNGTSGIALYQSTAAAARYLGVLPAVPQYCWANTGEFRQVGRHTVLSPSGQEGIRVVPKSAADLGEAAFVVTDPAESVQVGVITKGGYAAFTGLSVGANIILRCTTAGVLPIGALTINGANCGASVDTGIHSQ
jgi:hypothetical protein